MSDFFMQTHTGVRFDLLDPTPDMVRLEDIAYHLAHINRFGGAAGDYSVLEHSLLVADHSPADLELEALLHDAHEAYVNDVIGPMQSAMRSLFIESFPARLRELAEATPDPFATISRRVRFAVAAAFDIDVDVPRAVKDVDRRLRTTERDQLFQNPQPLNGPTPEAEPIRVNVRTYYPLLFPSPSDFFIAEVRKAMRSREEHP